MKVKSPTIEEIKAVAKNNLQLQIRNYYSVDDEFRILNKGIINPQDSEYLEYRATIDQLVTNYQQEAGELYERSNGN